MPRALRRKVLRRVRRSVCGAMLGGVFRRVCGARVMSLDGLLGGKGLQRTGLRNQRPEVDQQQGQQAQPRRQSSAR